jgi:hypothetical protein
MLSVLASAELWVAVVETSRTMVYCQSGLPLGSRESQRNWDCPAQTPDVTESEKRHFIRSQSDIDLWNIWQQIFPVFSKNNIFT